MTEKLLPCNLWQQIENSLEHYNIKKYTFESPNNFRAQTQAQKGLEALRLLRLKIFEIEVNFATHDCKSNNKGKL